MKKFISLILAGILSFSLVGCNTANETSINTDIEKMSKEELYTEFIEPLLNTGILSYNGYIDGENRSFNSYILISSYTTFVRDKDKDFYLETYELTPFNESPSYQDVVSIPVEIVEEELNKRFILEEDFFEEYEDFNKIEENYYINLHLNNQNYGSKLVDKESITINKTDNGYDINFDFTRLNAIIKLNESFEVKTSFNYTINLILEDGYYKYNTIYSKLNTDKLTNIDVEFLFMNSLKDSIIFLGNFNENEPLTADMELYGMRYTALMNIIYKISYEGYKYGLSGMVDIYNIDKLIASYENIFYNQNGEELKNLLILDDNYIKEESIVDMDKYISYTDNNICDVLSFNIEGDIITINYNIHNSAENYTGTIKIKLNDYSYSIISNEIN